MSCTLELGWLDEDTDLVESDVDISLKREIRRAKNGGYRGTCEPPVYIKFDPHNLAIQYLF